MLQIRTRHAPFFAPPSFVLTSAPVSSRQPVGGKQDHAAQAGTSAHFGSPRWRTDTRRRDIDAKQSRVAGGYPNRHITVGTRIDFKVGLLFSRAAPEHRNSTYNSVKKTRTKTGKEKPQWGPVRGALSLHAAHFPRPKVKSTDVTAAFLSGLRKLHFAS